MYMHRAAHAACRAVREWCFSICLRTALRFGVSMHGNGGLSTRSFQGCRSGIQVNSGSETNRARRAAREGCLLHPSLVARRARIMRALRAFLPLFLALPVEFLN